MQFTSEDAHGQHNDIHEKHSNSHTNDKNHVLIGRPVPARIMDFGLNPQKIERYHDHGYYQMAADEAGITFATRCDQWDASKYEPPENAV
jgi:hypothetical protein